MKASGKHLVYYAAAIVLLLPSLSFPDVNITLKNGMTIIAESCEDEGEKFICSKSGGTFEIQKGGIEEVREVKAVGRGQEEKHDSSEPVKAAPEESGDKTVKKDGDPQPGDASASLRKRLEQISERKKELIRERDALQKDRQKAQDEVKNAPDWMPEAQFNDLTKKNAEIDGRVKSFNEEVTKLNKEEADIGDQLKGGKEQKP